MFALPVGGFRPELASCGSPCMLICSGPAPAILVACRAASVILIMNLLRLLIIVIHMKRLASLRNSARFVLHGCLPLGGCRQTGEGSLQILCFGIPSKPNPAFARAFKIEPPGILC